MELSNEEIEACRDAFSKFDKDGSGAISDWELRAMLQCESVLDSMNWRCTMGQDPTDEELFDMIAEVDSDGSGEIDFSEFLKVIIAQKAKQAGQDDESDTDKTGEISTDKLRSIVKDFGLTIDIEKLIRETDTDHSGFIDYNEFKVMMKD
eukprot:5427277-Prymnesium_polylepis.1